MTSKPGVTIGKLMYIVVFAALAGFILLLLPGFVAGVPAWSLSRPELLVVLGLIAAFGAASIMIGIGWQQSDRNIRIMVVGASALVYVAVLLFVINRYIGSSAIVFPAVFLLSFVLIVIMIVAIRRAAIALGVMAAIAISLALTVDFSAAFRQVVGESAPSANIRSAYYNLEIKNYESELPRTVRGGALTLFGNRYLLATGNGQLFTVSLAETETVAAVAELNLSVPINSAEFVADVGDRVDESKFRVTDIVARNIGDDIRIFAAHHFWNSADQCFVLRLSSIDVTSSGVVTGDNPDTTWKTLYDTQPCLAIKSQGHPFGGHQAGGRLAFINEGQLLLTVGDHTFDGNGSPLILPQDPDAAYGKTIIVDPASGAAEVYSLGHRNPQGLYIDPQQRIWLTEHGPQGGDELNQVLRDRNYGWPFAIYGTAYGKLEWPLSKVQGEHDGYEVPIFSWMPSIGVSNVIGIETDLFPLWKGDLFVASLKGKTLRRIRVREGRVVYLEPILIGKRIRDIIEGHDGRIILWTDDAALVTIAPSPDGNTGELLFSQCSGCHEINDGSAHGIGPDLRGIYGRQIASAEGFEFSTVLRNTKGKWDRSTLDAFITDPQSFAPGTSMAFEGIADAEARSRLIDYLEANP